MKSKTSLQLQISTGKCLWTSLLSSDIYFLWIHITYLLYTNIYYLYENQRLDQDRQENLHFASPLDANMSAKPAVEI